MNRLVYESYSDGTPAATYVYDYGTNGKGHLTGVSNADSVTGFNSFDASGRVLTSGQITGGETYNFSYAYNLAGALTSETYPSGRVIAMSRDGADRVSAVTGTLNGQQTPYVGGIVYAPQDVPSFYGYGNQLARTVSYNSRLQWACAQDVLQNSPSEYLWRGCPNWGTTNNNGNLLGETDYEGGPGTLSTLAQFNRSYSYDGVSRLTAASDSGGWSRAFGYDRYGNMWGTGSGVSTGSMPSANVYEPGRGSEL